MPYKSQAQAGYFHTHKAELEKQGVNVDEWDQATKGKHLPKRAGMAQGGPVKKVVDQNTGDHIPKGEPFHHGRMAGGGGHPEGGIGGHNDGHGIYAKDAMYAQGGPVLKNDPDKHYKTKLRNDYGQFLNKSDRFTSGRKPAGFPEEAETAEDWPKPNGVGTKEEDDIGDCKKLKPVLPHASAGHHWYGKGNQPTTTETFHEDPNVQPKERELY